MKKFLFVFLLTFSSILKTSAADYYWVNGGGSWSDLNHWRLGSTSGSIPSIVPSSGDNVFFVAGSGFTAGSATVTLNSNGFCNNMTWTAVTNSPSFNTASALFTVQISGNAVLSPTTTYNVFFAFKGTTPATLMANGNVLGEFGIEIDKPGSSLTLSDNLNISTTTTTYGTGGLFFISGTFDISGKTVTLYRILSSNSNARTLLMSNANVTSNLAVNYTGLNKTLNAAGSTLSTGGLISDGGTYNKVFVTLAGGPNTNFINGTTFKTLTFTTTSQIYSDIESNNTVDTLVFAGQGSVTSNNTIGTVLFNGISFVNTGNTIGKLTALNKIQISGTNTIDSLLLAPNKVTTLAGTINISKYMKAQGVSCDAFTEITATDSAKLLFGPTATTLIDNVFLTNIKAYGSITPISVSGVDGDNNTGFNITAPTSLSGANLYWVGGAGDWNDNTHWSYTSGGPGGACIPFIADTVIFNSASGLAPGNVVSTSGNTYCRNVYWLPGVGTSVFSESGTSRFNIFGSAVLNASITMNAGHDFVGNDSTTITFNNSTLGALDVTVNKPASGGGSLTLVDNWSNTNGDIFVTVGRINMSGRTLNIRAFSSNNNYIRNVNITDANIQVGNTWAYSGNNNFIQSSNSHIISDLYLNINNRTYPFLQLTYGGPLDVFLIRDCTIDSLTFTSTSATSTAKVLENNIIRRLEFKGAGNITGNNNIDTLILAGSRNYAFSGTMTLNKYLFAQSSTCTGLLEMRGNTTATFAFAPTAIISMANVYLQNMTATGVPPVAVSGADAGGNSGWNITSTAGSLRYWIGGSGDWNDNSHWSTTSGGTGGACIPTVFDNVYFNASSGFTAANKTVTVNNGNAYCRNLDWSAATNSPIWNKATAWNIEVWGDTVKLNPSATFNVSLTFKGSNTAILSGSALGNFDIRVSKVGGSLQLLNNYANLLTDIYVNDGTLNLSGRTVSAASINNEGLANTMDINISNATITLDSLWRYNGTASAHTLTAANSIISSEVFMAQGMTYNDVNVSGITNTGAVFSAAAIGRLTFTDTNPASQIGINGTNNIIGIADYKGSGGIYGTGNTINTLIFFPGGTYTLTAGTNTTITGDWFGSGTPCNLTEIVSSSSSANATVTVTGSAPEFDYVRVRRITASGSVPFVAYSHSINQGNNINWDIAPYDGAAPIYGLGADTALLPTAFPYTLHTDGFFGTPSSQYIWNDGSTANSLVITDTGTYSVTVNFADGCTISDTIHITFETVLPVTLINFDVHVQNCQAYLDWNVTDAVNFSRFAVERSRDSRHFADLAMVAYSNNTGRYAYIDKSMGKGTSFYRLRLIDMDGRYQYSKVVAVQSGCDHQVEVYPTVTKGIVFVNLPSGYEGAKIEVFTSLGQLLKLPNSDNAGTGLRSIPFNGLAQGNYFLRISNDSEIQTFKVFYQP